MEASGWDIIIAVFALLAVLGGIFKFFWSLHKVKFYELEGQIHQIDEKFGEICKRFDKADDLIEHNRNRFGDLLLKIDQRFDDTDKYLRDIISRMNDLNVRLTIAETRIEERKPIFYPPVVAPAARQRRARRGRRKQKE